jgi:hypothetical protein
MFKQNVSCPFLSGMPPHECSIRADAQARTSLPKLYRDEGFLQFAAVNRVHEQPIDLFTGHQTTSLAAVAPTAKSWHRAVVNAQSRPIVFANMRPMGALASSTGLATGLR